MNPLYNDLKILNADYILGKKENGFHYSGIDAQMQVDGIPQSATGQASIFTGLNTQKLMNGHIFAYPPRSLIRLIFKNSLFSSLKKLGKKSVFINAYTENYFRLLENDFGIDAKRYEIKDINTFIQSVKYKHRFSVTTIQNLSVNNPFYDINDIEAGRSIFHDIDGHTLLKYGLLKNLPSPEKIRDAFLYNLDNYDLVLFEYFLTDVYGHKKDYDMVYRSLKTLDDLLEILSSAVNPDNTSILVASDHGNIEDLTVSSHTINKAAFIFKGNKKGFGFPEKLDETSRFVLGLLS